MSLKALASCEGLAFCWDFEDGQLPKGFVSARDEYVGDLLVDSTKPKNGRYALHIKGLHGGIPGQNGGPKKSVVFRLPENFGPVLWGRAYVYTSPEAPISHAGIFNARYAPAGTNYRGFEQLDWYEVASYKERYMAIWHPPEPPGFPEWVLLAEKPLVIDAWTCVEWLFDAEAKGQDQAADPKLWVNGEALSWAEQFVYSEPAGAPRPYQNKADSFSLIEMGVIMYQGLSTPTDWWLDDVAISQSRIGCAD